MSKFGSIGAGAKPFRVFIKLDGKQVLDKDDKPFFIDVHAEDGPVGRRFDKEWRDYALALAKEGKDQPTQLEQNIAKCAHRLLTTRNSLFGMSFCSASQSAGGKNMSCEKATTRVLAVIRPSAAARSPPVCLVTSPCRHFQPIQIKLFGSIGRK